MKHTERKSHQSPRKCVQDFVDLTVGIGFQMPQFSVATRTLFLGGQNLFLGGGQSFWVGLHFSEFSVDLRKKEKRHRANLVYFCSSSLVDLLEKRSSRQIVLFISPNKKSHHLETAASEREFGWACWASWGGEIFV